MQGSKGEVGEKRLREEGTTSQDLSYGKKIRAGVPSLPEYVFKQALGNQPLFHQLICELEPLIRNVVREEVANGGRQLQLRRSPRVQQIRPRVETAAYRLSFPKRIATQIFTLTNVKDSEGGELQVSLEHVVAGGSRNGPSATLPASVRVELVVLEGQFAGGEGEKWTQEEFEKSVVMQREEKRPLMVGNTSIVVRDGGPTTIPELMFTDNSSWVRSKKFRIGARAVLDNSHKGLRIEEAVTNVFKVKDNRGKAWEKHYPPYVEDQVWRLEGIGKDGIFHTKLSKYNINNVGDFLVGLKDRPSYLKQILGMSEKSWEKTVSHAAKAISTFGPACQLDAAYTSDNFPGENTGHVNDLEWEDYMPWNTLEVDERSALNNVLIQNGYVLPIDNVAGSSSGNQGNNQTESSQFMDKQVQPSEPEDDEFDSWGMSAESSEWTH